MTSQTSIFWLEWMPSLFENIELFPKPYMTLEEQCNALTRLILIIWAGLFIVDYKYHTIFLINSLFFIIILYYIQRNMTFIKENYSNCSNNMNVTSNINSNVNGNSSFSLNSYNFTPMNTNSEMTLPLSQTSDIPTLKNLQIQSPNQYTFCQDAQPVSYNSNLYSRNQGLAGNQNLSLAQTQQNMQILQDVNPNLNSYQSNIKIQGNPKVLNPPITIAPMYAGDYWMAPELVPFKINSRNFTEEIQSGYRGKSPSKGRIRCSEPILKPVQDTSRLILPDTNSGMISNENSIEKYSGLSPAIVNNPEIMHTKVQSGEDTYKFGSHNYLTGGNDNVDNCGCYNANKLKHGIPPNVPAGKCQMMDSLNTYNKNLYTIPIQPGMNMTVEYQQEPVSNLGISSTPQFQPVTCDKNGNYITHDSRITPPIYPVGENEPVTPNNYNIYDPRSAGYGDSSRTYIDELTGQPRFYYDDVDAYRKPNYIVRSNIDHLKFANQYGPMESNAHYESMLCRTNELAQQDFLNGQLKLRNDLQVGYMNKYNTEIAGQKRLMPLSRAQN
jgi:hypothetical protein